MTKPLRSEQKLTKSSKRTARASCATCGKSWESSNALAPASIHARSHGHLVHASAVLQMTYDGRAEG